MNDYVAAREFPMDQKSISLMLGVRREGVIAAAGGFQTAQLISYRRGRIRVIDAQGLGKKACECYRLIRQQYRHLQGELAGLLSLKWLSTEHPGIRSAAVGPCRVRAAGPE